MATAVTVSATNNAEIDGLLSGVKWSGTISYSFPDAASDYLNPYSGGDGEPTTSGFASAPTQMQSAINYAIGLILSYTNATIQFNGTGSADIMIAESPAANPTSYAYYPGNYAPGGDVWFGTQYDYTLAKLGNYYFATALHELGHALGLKHSQETGGPANVAVPSAHDDSEYTIMSYRSYVGASTTTGYTNEAYGYPQTYMANDILALQTMYGANYTTQSSNTIYTWSPTTGQEFINGVGQLADGGGVGGSANRIFETIWDGGGIDTYDLSNYTTNLSINLNPGASSVFSTVQLANLGSGHYAAGNVYNAYLYNGDARSYIDNATGGSGNDTIIGNAIANILIGGAGNDTITGGGGNDTIIGGAGTDTALYSGSKANYAITYDTANQTFTVVDLRAGSPNGTDTVTGVESFQFADGVTASSALTGAPKPDLSEYTAVGQSSVAAGANLTLDVYNMNLGDAVAGPSTARIYLSTDATITTSDTLLATVSTSMTLATVSQPGYYDHQTILVAVPGNLAPGTYYIGGIADYNNQLSEGSETNNTYNVVQVTVTAPARPDLSEYVAVDKSSAAAGSSLTVDAYNMNLGDAVVATPTTAGIYISTDATITASDTLLTTISTTSTLATVSQPGYYDHQTITVTLPGNLAPGTYYVGGLADYNNLLGESNETNNAYNVVQVTVTPPAQPDLSEYVVVNKTTVVAGDTLTVDAYNMNLGNAVAATPTTAGIYISTDATITTSDTLLTTISTTSTLATVSQPGYSDHQTVSVTLPGNLAPGTYYVGGLADYNNHLTESNETNNTYNVVQVTVAAPDLSEYVAVNKTTVVPGDSLTVDAYNMNLGNAVAATPTTAGIYLSTDATITTSDTLLTTISTTATLATVSQPGYYDHQTVTVTLPGNLTPGTYYVGGLADYNNHLTESNETNNAYNVVQVTVAAANNPPAQSTIASSLPAQTTANAGAGAGGELPGGRTSVQDNFALFHADNWQGGAHEADHAQLTQLISELATAVRQLANVTDAHFMFDQVSEVMQDHMGIYHLV